MSQIAHYENKLSYEIDSWDLHEAIKAGQDIVVFDARSEASFDASHIAGAISFPHQKMIKSRVADLNTDSLYIVYCDGIGCNAATTAALKMAKLGFNVRELIGGLYWWKEHDYPTNDSYQDDLVSGCG